MNQVRVHGILMPPDSAPTLEQLYRDHFDFVFRLAKRLAPRLDPEDVAQEVFMVVSRKLDQFNDDHARPTTWLYAITFNVVRALRRKALRRLLRQADEAAAYDVPVMSLDAVEVRDAWRIATQILSSMPAKKRDVFILSELEGLTCAEIAAVVGAKEQTVWSRLHYARIEFSQRLAKFKVSEAQD